MATQERIGSGMMIYMMELGWPIEEKLVQHCLGWFGNIQQRPPEARVHSGRLKCADNVKRGRGRPNLTWEESVK